MPSNFRELIFKIYQRKQIDRTIFQPRLMLWYNGNYVSQKNPQVLKNSPLNIDISRRNENVPPEWIGKNIVEIHKELDASIRYTGETMGLGYFYHNTQKNAKIIRKSENLEDGSIITKIETPIGTVFEKRRHGYTLEKMIKQPEDFKTVKYLIEQDEFCYNPFLYEAALEELGELGVPQTYYFRSPYQRCVLEFLGFERTTLFLRRYQNLMDDFMQFLEEWDKKAYKTIINSDLQILNFGENIDCNLSPPRQFEKYLLPYYQERVKWLKNAPIPKFCHAHFDGHVKDLLPYLADLPFDGIEALTPEPQGDVTLEELRDSIGNKILLDGIPATLFMHEFPESKLIECVNKILEYFCPNLILGISDELPGNTDGRRLKTVSEIVSKYRF